MKDKIVIENQYYDDKKMTHVKIDEEDVISCPLCKGKAFIKGR